MKILILGGGGFIGSAITDRLLLDGHTLRVFEHPRVPPYRSFMPNEPVEWVTGDFLSPTDIARAMEGCEMVIHLISTTLPKNSCDDPVFDVQSNLIGSLQMLDIMLSHNIKDIVFISSGGTVYGEPVYVPIDERHPTNPSVSYGITKLAIEKYLLMYRRLYDLRPRILRVANPYGNRQRIETAQGAVGVFLHRALLDLVIDIWGDGNVVRDYLHVGDVADAFSCVIPYRGNESVFNISSGAGTSLNELLTIMESVLGKTVERRYLPKRSFDVPVSVLDNSLAQRELGWQPKISLHEGIRRTVGWLCQ